MRARNIKPGLFKNEILGAADPIYTVLFEGLWCLADREGRLEDRPLRVKAEVFPYRDGLDCDALLGFLAENGFIIRYAAEGKNYLQINNFSRHQNPHKGEKASEIPEYTGTSTVQAQCKDGTSTVQAQCKDGTSTVQAQCKDGTSTEVVGLIPDSGYLIPDSGYLIPDSNKESARKRGSRLPPEFDLTADREQAAIDAGINPRSTMDGFRDYWVSVPGSKGVKLDWDATWRNWCRRQKEFGGAKSKSYADQCADFARAHR